MAKPPTKLLYRGLFELVFILQGVEYLVSYFRGLSRPTPILIGGEVDLFLGKKVLLTATTYPLVNAFCEVLNASQNYEWRVAPGAVDTRCI
jgi:cytochrome c oxidase subunit IV